MMLNAARWSVLGMLSIAAVGCAYKSPVAPTAVTTTPSPAPASIRLTASSRTDYQTAIVATVLTADGRFVAGIPIGFSTPVGTVSVSLATTDANGSATTVVATPTTTMVTVTVGAVTNTIQVSGASAPTVPPTPPVVTAPTPSPTTPTAAINAPSTATTNVAITFGVSAPALGQTWTWSFGDTTTAQTTAFTTTHTYTTAGVYTVTISGPGIQSGSTQITITNATSSSAAPALIVSLTCTAGTATATLTRCNVSAVDETGASVAPINLAVDWSWGDASAVEIAVSAVRNHTYAQVGTYTVQTSASYGGRSGRTSLQVVIK